MRALAVLLLMCVAADAARAAPPPPPILEDDGAARDDVPEVDEPDRRRMDLDDERPPPLSELQPDKVWPRGSIEVALAQIGAGLGVAAGLVVVSTAAVVGLALCGPTLLGSSAASLLACGLITLPVCGGPCAVGGTETWVANTLTGRDESAMLPVLAAYAGLVLGGIGAAGVGGLLLGTTTSCVSGPVLGPACAVAGCTAVTVLAVLPIVTLPAGAWAIAGNDPVSPDAPPPDWDDVGRPVASLSMAY